MSTNNSFPGEPVSPPSRRAADIEYDPIRARLHVTRGLGTLVSVIGIATAQLAAHLGVYDVPNMGYYELFGIVSLIWLVVFWWLPWPRGKNHAPAVMSISCLGLVMGTVALTGAGQSLAWVYAMPLAFYNGLYFRPKVAVGLLPLFMSTGMIPAVATQDWVAFQDQLFIVAPVYVIVTLIGIAVVPELRGTAEARLQSALATQRAADAERWTERLQSVQDGVWEAHQSSSVEQICAAMMGQIQKTIDFDSCLVHLTSDHGLEVIIHEVGNGSDMISGSAPICPHGGERLAGWVVREAQPLRLNDIDSDERNLRVLKTGNEPESALAVPLRGHGEVAGVITLYKAGRGQFSEDDLRAMMILGDHAGTAISNAQLLAVARHDAETDGLTGLLNQSASRLHLGALLGDRDAGEELSVVLLDLNDFKPINDALGHLAGDKMLCRLAEILHSSCRKGDIVARSGGDEFMVILPDAGRDTAEAIGTIIQQTAVTEGADLGIASSIPISLSFGVATAPSDGETVTELLEAADLRLYARKRQPKQPWPLDIGAASESMANAAE